MIKNSVFSHFLPGMMIGILVCVFIQGCTKKQIPRDILNYVNRDMLNISQLEVNALKAYASVTDQNYTTDERVLEVLKITVIPYYQRFAELLREISPESEKLKRIHWLYVNGAEGMLNGFRAKMIGIENNDIHLIRMANNQIIAGRNETLKWKTKLNELLQQHAVRMN